MTTATFITVYTTEICPYCVRAKALLKQKGLNFEEVDVTHDTAKRQWLVKKTGMRTVPQIFVHGKPIGGYIELAQLDSQGKLQPLLKP